MSGRHVLYDASLGRRTAGETVTLARAEVGHARTLRLRPGDAVRVTDGCGALWNAEVVGVGGPTTLRLESRCTAPAPLPLDLWPPVGNKQATLWLVEKAVEFGARSVTAVECERSASVADAARTSGFWEKAQRRAVAALKQSAGAWLPRIAPPVTFEEMIAGCANRDGSCVFVDGDGPPLATILRDRRDPVGVLIGPEGGLSARERSECEVAGMMPAGLGPTILRFETAAVAALAIVAQENLQSSRYSGNPEYGSADDE